MYDKDKTNFVEVNKTLSEYIKGILNSCETTQDQFAIALGTNRNSVSNFFTGIVKRKANEYGEVENKPTTSPWCQFYHFYQTLNKVIDEFNAKQIARKEKALARGEEYTEKPAPAFDINEFFALVGIKPPATDTTIKTENTSVNTEPQKPTTKNKKQSVPAASPLGDNQLVINEDNNDIRESLINKLPNDGYSADDGRVEKIIRFYDDNKKAVDDFIAIEFRKWEVAYEWTLNERLKRKSLTKGEHIKNENEVEKTKREQRVEIAFNLFSSLIYPEVTVTVIKKGKKHENVTDGQRNQTQRRFCKQFENFYAPERFKDGQYIFRT
ncbi:MAG: hypothetical protein FWE84_02170 [Firmicutes bacterium]|nr:hypothetical protein [Bacillota bacterium]